MEPSPPQGSGPPPSPESLFASWLSRREGSEGDGIEDLCRRHPEQAGELRQLHSDWRRLDGIQRMAGLAGSLSERIRSRYGPGVDPAVELDGEGAQDGGESDGSDAAGSGDGGAGGSTARLMGRLGGRGASSGRYRLRGEIAQGGMGAILAVWDEDLRRQLAMKVMRGGEEDARLLARFLEEAQVTGQLDHPGIVPVHELGLDGRGRVYFTMKLVQGRTLEEVLDELARGEGGWSRTRVLDLFLRACEAVSFAHAKGVIHRDLKPANVMVGRFGEVYVMDWGLARVLGREDRRDVRVRPAAESGVRSLRSEEAAAGDSPLLTMDGDVIGTPAYMPPEQASGRLAEMGTHSDVYALGAMLYQLLAGHRPYLPPGKSAGPHALL